MAKLITCAISSLSCSILFAQPAANSKDFSTQLKELINHAKTDFKNLPPNFKLEGTIFSEIKKASDNSFVYRSLIAKKVSIKKAEELMTQWRIKIENALGDEYVISKKNATQFPKEILFRNKSNDSVAVIKLLNQLISNRCEIYLEISHQGIKQSRITNHSLDSLEITTRMKKVIMNVLGVDENEITSNASFTNDLGADSLDTVELVMGFEKEFGISIPDAVCEGLTTVGEMNTYLQEHVKKQ